MHLVLGSERVDLRDRVLVIGRTAAPTDDVPGADLAWVSTVPGDAAAGPLPVGADASTPADVHRLADAGVVAVGLPSPTAELTAAALERQLTVLVPAAVGSDAVPRHRLLVAGAAPIDGAVACLDLDGTGPAAWARATVALVAGVRVVRTSEPRSIRRVATVVERLTDAGEAS